MAFNIDLDRCPRCHDHDMNEGAGAVCILYHTEHEHRELAIGKHTHMFYGRHTHPTLKPASRFGGDLFTVNCEEGYHAMRSYDDEPHIRRCKWCEHTEPMMCGECGADPMEKDHKCWEVVK